MVKTLNLRTDTKFLKRKMKKKIALLTGGNSSEYPISLRSATEMSKHIDKEKYELYLITIKNTEWIVSSGLACDIPIDKNDFSFTYQNQKTNFDLIIFAIHGTPAEDGKLQAYFDMLKIPYIGSDVLTSALTFDKFTCNSFLRKQDILMAKAEIVRKGEQVDTDKIIEKLGLPIFVKPNNGGSSYGASKVKTAEELIPAINLALREDETALIEEFIDGLEVTCGLLSVSGNEIVFPLTEIVHNSEFFDTETKYNADLVDEITPARISDELTEKIKKESLRIYKILNCKGLVRIDYFIRENEVYFIEVNTIPGMTATSLVPKQINESEYTFKQIFDLMINERLGGKCIKNNGSI